VRSQALVAASIAVQLDVCMRRTEVSAVQLEGHEVLQSRRQLIVEWYALEPWLNVRLVTHCLHLIGLAGYTK
jgi:hypothetical protein